MGAGGDCGRKEAGYLAGDGGSVQTNLAAFGEPLTDGQLVQALLHRGVQLGEDHVALLVEHDEALHGGGGGAAGGVWIGGRRHHADANRHARPIDFSRSDGALLHYERHFVH